MYDFPLVQRGRRATFYLGTRHDMMASAVDPLPKGMIR